MKRVHFYSEDIHEVVSIILVAGSLLTNEAYSLIQAVNHNECLNVCKIYGTCVTTIILTCHKFD